MSDEYSYTPDDKKDVLDDIASHLGFKKSKDDKQKHDEIDKELLKKLDESDPHDQSKMFQMIQQNPPDPDFMKVAYFNGKDEDGREIIVTKSKGKEVVLDPFHVFSPYDGFKADIAAAPMHVIPMLLDEKENVEVTEKKASMPKKRKNRKEMMYVYIVVLSIVGSIVAGGFLLMRFMGG